MASHGYRVRRCTGDRSSDRQYVADLSASRKIAGAQVTIMEVIGLLLALGVSVYLVIALLLPEKFQ